MEEKCFCHFNGYQVKDAFARKKMKNFATPEEFGAVGDGIADDTEAVQNAIDHCISTGAVLSSNGGKYLVSGVVISDVCNIEFNNGTLIGSSIDPVLTYSAYQKDRMYARDLVIDCNRISACGMKCDYITSSAFYNITVKNIIGYGIWAVAADANVHTYELMFDTVSLFGDENTDNTIGIWASSDSHFNNIVGLNLKTMIYNYGTNFFDKIHGWLGNYAFMDGSIMINNYGGGHYQNIYVDTYHIGIRFSSTKTPVTFDKIFAYYNPGFWRSDLEPTVFYYASEKTFEQSTVNNVIIYPVGMEGINTYYSNLSTYITAKKSVHVHVAEMGKLLNCPNFEVVPEFNGTDNLSMDGKVVVRDGKAYVALFMDRVGDSIPNMTYTIKIPAVRIATGYAVVLWLNTSDDTVEQSIGWVSRDESEQFTQISFTNKSAKNANTVVIEYIAEMA